LKSAPGFSGVAPDQKTSPIFVDALHRAVDLVTPKSLIKDMNEVILRCSNYLSAFVRDRDKSLQTLLKMMKSNPRKELCKRENYEMNYGTGAAEIEAAPLLVPFAPIKDIADEAKSNLTRDMQSVTPPQLTLSMKALIQDVSRYLSQPFALRSGLGGKRYPVDLLAAVLTSMGRRPLFKYKAYGQTYADAGEV
ncbi:jg12839, partial [Pararge aegeria aegeria]